MKPTQEQVIAWAREAGIQELEIEGGEPDYCGTIGNIQAAFTLAYAAGAADEREACAKVCDNRKKTHQDNYGGFIGQSTKISEAGECADAIRARGES